MPDTVKTAVRRGIWSKILGKNSVKKLVNKGGCLKTVLCSPESHCNFLSIGVILVYLLFYDVILVALFWIY